jgi:hypothetical protein
MYSEQNFEKTILFILLVIFAVSFILLIFINYYEEKFLDAELRLRN